MCEINTLNLGGTTRNLLPGVPTPLIHRGSEEIANLGKQFQDALLGLDAHLKPHILMVGGPGSVHPSAFKETLKDVQAQLNELFSSNSLANRDLSDADRAVLAQLVPVVNTFVQAYEEYIGLGIRYEAQDVVVYLNQHGEEITKQEFERISEGFTHAVEQALGQLIQSNTADAVKSATNMLTSALKV